MINPSWHTGDSKIRTIWTDEILKKKCQELQGEKERKQNTAMVTDAMRQGPGEQEEEKEEKAENGDDDVDSVSVSGKKN